MASTLSNPVVVSDDIVILPDAPATPPGRRRWLKALVPALPWSWFLIRSLHPVLDYVAIGLPILILVAALGSLAGLVVGNRLMWGATTLSLVLFFLVSVLGPWRPIDAAAPVADQTIRVAAVNLGLYWFSDNDGGYLIEEQQVDFLVGTELAESHDAEFRSRFAHAAGDILPLERQQNDAVDPVPTSDNYRGFGLPSLGVYSNYPIEVLDDPIAEQFDGGLPGLRVRLDAPAGPIVIYALHIPKPSPSSGPYQVSVGDHIRLTELIAEAIASERDPVMVIGDLNSVDRSIAYRTLTADLTDGMRHSSWAAPTTDRDFPWTLLFARIDHLLISDSLCAVDSSSEDTRFSDHRPIVATVGPCETN